MYDCLKAGRHKNVSVRFLTADDESAAELLPVLQRGTFFFPSEGSDKGAGILKSYPFPDLTDGECSF